MASTALSEVPAGERSSASVKIGWALSAIAIVFLGSDAGAKLVVPAMMAAHTPSQLKIPSDPSLYRLLGMILALCTLLYGIPRTAILGAVLLTGYLGGSIATHLLAGSPLISNTLFGAYLGLAVWGGLWLRDSRLRRLLPLRSQA